MPGTTHAHRGPPPPLPDFLFAPVFDAGCPRCGGWEPVWEDYVPLVYCTACASDGEESVMSRDVPASGESAQQYVRRLIGNGADIAELGSLHEITLPNGREPRRLVVAVGSTRAEAFLAAVRAGLSLKLPCRLCGAPPSGGAWLCQKCRMPEWRCDDHLFRCGWCAAPIPEEMATMAAAIGVAGNGRQPADGCGAEAIPMTADELRRLGAPDEIVQFGLPQAAPAPLLPTYAGELLAGMRMGLRGGADMAAHFDRMIDGLAAAFPAIAPATRRFKERIGALAAAKKPGVPIDAAAASAAIEDLLQEASAAILGKSS